MFGKRSASNVRNTAAAPSLAVPSSIAAAPTAAGIVQAHPSPPTQHPAPALEPQRSGEYYVTKSMIFSALVEAIDLSQLSRLDADSAREEIRDIVHEIVAIKNVALSIGEQQDLIDDIC